MIRHQAHSSLALGCALVLLFAACVAQGSQNTLVHRWWNRLGPVLPHETFPAECEMCHTGTGWHVLSEDFEYDHLAETGVALLGAHARAQCLRCHNDRGPVEIFAARGCAGCHEDVHFGELGPSCTNCHQQSTWQPTAQFALHYHGRFPLTGVHATTACRSCHPGAEVGQFLPTDPDCVTCHQKDLANAVNPNHIALGWVDNCNRCHQPTDWNQAEL